MTRVKQGCVLSPLLFILVVDYILSNCEGYGIDIGEPARLGELDFADDISLLETCKLRLQTFIKSVKIQM